VGFLPPLVAAAILSVASIGTLATTSTETSYAVALGGYMLAWIAAFPYLMALCARFDPRGRLGALVYGVQNAAAGTGTFVAGLVFDRAGPQSFLLLAALGIMIGTALLLVAVPFRPQAEPTTA
jgi:predicted MFS family arabinose efflux permease